MVRLILETGRLMVYNGQMEGELLTIGQAAEYLGVSQNTLRRWDESGKLVAIRKEGGTHRYYFQRDLDVFASDLIKIAHDWVQDRVEFPKQFYCDNTSVFQARLTRFESLLMSEPGYERLFSLIVAIVGEIGNNSFDHNLGKWPDDPGIFFGYDIHKKIAVLADRGLGILETLRQVRSELPSHVEAVRVAFTEVVSGRSPEKRGNGLKYVREVVRTNPVNLFFASGDAEVRIQEPDKKLLITRSSGMLRGCFAVIKF